jgi:hypothetical protein
VTKDHTVRAMLAAVLVAMDAAERSDGDYDGKDRLTLGEQDAAHRALYRAYELATGEELDGERARDILKRLKLTRLAEQMKSTETKDICEVLGIAQADVARLPPDRPLSIGLSEQAHDVLEQLVASGLYGAAKERAAEELIYLGLREIVARGTFAALPARTPRVSPARPASS